MMRAGLLHYIAGPVPVSVPLPLRIFFQVPITLGMAYVGMVYIVMAYIAIARSHFCSGPRYLCCSFSVTTCVPAPPLVSNTVCGCEDE